MKKVTILLALLTATVFTNCDNDTINTVGTTNRIEINTNQAQLNGRIDFSNSGVISIINTSQSGRNSSDISNELPLNQISEIKPPKDANGVTLQASHVCVNGKYTYVAYNLQGDDYSGAIDVIDVTDPYKPLLIMSALIADTDVNSITYSNGRLLIAGATNMYKSPNLSSPAIIMNMELNSGLLTSTFTENNIDSFSTLDISANDNSYYAVTGDIGKLFKFDNSTKQITGSIKSDDLRSVALYQDKVVTLSGKNGVSVYNQSDLGLVKTFSNWSDNINGAKRTIDFHGQKLLVSEGSQGLGVYDINSGNKIQSISLNEISSINPEDAVTNAVSVNGDYVFSANGAQGVNVFKAETTELNFIGTLGLDGSANYVKTSGDYIYVANGKGGLKIIKAEKSEPVNSCIFPIYNGGQDLVIDNKKPISFSGPATINTLEIRSNGSLEFCGSLSVQNELTINSNSTLKITGTLNQGNNTTKKLSVKSNAELIIDGSIVIWGDLDLSSNSKLIFLGNNSSITVFGKVNKSSNVKIIGTYTDTENKL